MNAGLLLLGIGFVGFILGALIVLTMATPASHRAFGIAFVIVVSCLVLGLLFTGKVTALGTALLLPLLAPAITALAVRAYSQWLHERYQTARRA